MKQVFQILEASYVKLIGLLATIAIILFMMIAGWIVLEVFQRTFDLPTIPGIVDFTEHAIYSMTILAAPWILHKNGHVKVLIVIESLPPTPQAAVMILANLISAAVCLIVAYYSAINFWVSYQRQEFIFGELVVREWWLQWQAPVAFTLLTVGFAREIMLIAKHQTVPQTLIKE